MAEWHSIATFPADRPLQLCVIDQQGVHHLQFPCRWVDGCWVNAVTNSKIPFTPTHWREWKRAEQVAAAETQARVRVNHLLIGAELVILYDEFLHQPIPPSICTLLDQLAQRELEQLTHSRAPNG